MKYETQLFQLNKERCHINLGLERIEGFLNHIGNPQDTFKSVIIGGTNGKGSTTYYLSNLACKTTNYKIGRYISPHLIRINERFVINEEEVSNRKLNTIAKEVKKYVNDFEKRNPRLGKLTEFEIYTAIAFLIFAKEKVDIAFLEVGLGGRLDATNTIKTENLLCSIITNISYDHTDLLGRTIEEIAYEKAGIIKRKNTIITSANDGFKTISSEAKKLNAKLIKVKTSNLKTYLDKNIEIAIRSWDFISKELKVKKDINKKQFLNKLKFRGRFQHLKKENILLDGAHNPGAAKELKRLIERDFKYKKKLFIVGFLNKDYKSFINNLISKNDYVICTEPKSNRATKKEIIETYLRNRNIHTEKTKSIKEALKLAKNKSFNLTIITGSLYLVGEALELLE